MSTKRPIILVDGFNLFIRHFVVNESVNTQGELIGGVVGFLRSLRWICSTLMPSKVFIVWEQGGGSPRRKHIYPEYKANRAKQKDFANLYKSNGKINAMSNTENKAMQLAVLTKAIGYLPFCQLYVPDVECDDVVAWLVKNKFVTEENDKIIVSSDKDFFQLLEDPKVKIYDPGKKNLVNALDVKENFGVAPRNIVLARTIAGDASDNIDGVSGLGIKTVINNFPELLNETVDYDIDWLFTRCNELRESRGKKVSKALESLSVSRDIIERNWKLMYLSNGSLSANQIAKLNGRIDEFEPILNKIEYLKVLTSADIPVSIDMDQLSNEITYLKQK